MKVEVACKTRKERAAIELALTRPDVRAFCVIVGLLDPLPSEKMKERVLRFVSENMAEKSATPYGRGYSAGHEQQMKMRIAERMERKAR